MKRLIKAGRKDLAKRVEWVSETQGDGIGYDIKSFETTGRHLFIEVKTTRSGENSPFYITRTEVDFAERHEKQYCLYRIFNFPTSPQMFPLRGSLKRKCHLTPELYGASF